jgi:hypothetical protein
MPLKQDIASCFKGYTALANAVDALKQTDLDELVTSCAEASQAEGDGRLKDAKAAWNRFDGKIGILREKFAACRAARDV